jgi:small-conductance mechanosensitive channel
VVFRPFQIGDRIETANVGGRRRRCGGTAVAAVERQTG